MEKFIRKPDITMYAGITVGKDTTLEYKNDNVEQKLENLTFKSVTNVIGENYESVYHTTIHLKEGDILIFEEGQRVYKADRKPNDRKRSHRRARMYKGFIGGEI